MSQLLRSSTVMAALGIVTVLSLVSCAQAPPTQEPPLPAAAKASPTPPAGDHTLFEINEPESLLLIKVMRSGPLSRFGHNHIIGGPVIGGRVWLAEKLADSRVELTIRLLDMQVDEPQWRLEAGEDFTSVPSDEDIAGTRANMMSPKVLDTDNFPVATAEVSGILGAAPDFSVLARITLKGNTRSLPIPVHFERQENRFVATGTFGLTQSDFAIEPFSVLLGAISVQDEVQVQYTIVASASP
ncbi:MAG: YceI family protein [Gammaproteobacteria bacterium]|nr:YceI family protein [Gammaproteobacteria bacterium]